MLRLKLLRHGGKVEDDVSTLRRPVRPQQQKHVIEYDTMRYYHNLQKQSSLVDE
jgi:hypothetical protein